ncbi:hypothetical protein [Emcibacter nanhaiensis]|uniref:Uncharacterized protein n=1 Tax=Emcibacter nanhaiensis TaxID=1505037 RepID=A0A501PGN7_9PROT|nr:hypothetical protein [Emcibacter nanhaiensis]TPD59365.1 hypothetical protein FIV46_11260 [Emcibacter nanhaiensis]
MALAALILVSLWHGSLFAVVLNETTRQSNISLGESLISGDYAPPAENVENGHFFQLSYDANQAVRTTQQFDLAENVSSGSEPQNDPAQREMSLSDSSLFEQNIGSFLENLNDSPTLKTIYFNSQQLKFNFQSKFVNEFGELVGDEMPLDKRLFMDNSDALGITASSSTSRGYIGGRSLVDQIVESLQSLAAIIILFFALIYLSFRYVLNKYM